MIANTKNMNLHREGESKGKCTTSNQFGRPSLLNN